MWSEMETDLSRILNSDWLFLFLRTSPLLEAHLHEHICMCLYKDIHLCLHQIGLWKERENFLRYKNCFSNNWYVAFVYKNTKYQLLRYWWQHLGVKRWRAIQKWRKPVDIKRKQISLQTNCINRWAHKQTKRDNRISKQINQSYKWNE